MNITGAQAIIDSLVAEGVDTIFGYPGGGIMPFYDQLHFNREKLHHILVRHEQAAVHAAEGYARSSGKVGVCVATAGPGATNLVTGIADAMMDSTPIVCITAQVQKEGLGASSFQEADIISITLALIIQLTSEFCVFNSQDLCCKKCSVCATVNSHSSDRNACRHLNCSQ